MHREREEKRRSVEVALIGHNLRDADGAVRPRDLVAKLVAVLRRRAQTPSGQWGAIEEHDRAMRAIAPEERPNLDKANDDTRP